KPYNDETLKQNINDIDICVTHWGAPLFTEDVLKCANRLKMIAHAAGSAGYIATDAVYEREITVCTSNDVMARHVAEGVLAYTLSVLRLIPIHDAGMKMGLEWDRKFYDTKSLIGAQIGLVGLGMVGRHLLNLLKPFGVSVKLYDPYVSQQDIGAYDNVQLSALDEVLSFGDIISVHAAQTPETIHLLDTDKLALIRDRSLLVNTARGKIIDQQALTDELKSGRISAVLDVYDREPLPVESGLRKLDNVILIPHMAGSTAKEHMSVAMIEEIRRFINHEPLKYEISYDTFKRMTRKI
ncbi:MAG: hydroxyacid dehydrogenase, partial [Halanaerobiales bacterium]|nr:hydroxyacid dehydrogenase [Halanaerobiales bacterium]